MQQFKSLRALQAQHCTDCRLQMGVGAAQRSNQHLGGGGLGGGGGLQAAKQWGQGCSVHGSINCSCRGTATHQDSSVKLMYLTSNQ